MSDVELNYYIFGDKPSTVDFVTIERNEHIGTLRDKIHERYKKFTNGSSLVEPALYKIDVPINKLAGIQVPPETESLINRTRVDTHWPEDAAEDHVQVLVVAKVTQQRSPSPQDTLGGLPELFQKLQDGQEEAAKGFRDGYSASQAALLNEFTTQQNENKNPIFNGRPYNRTALSIQLFHPIFDTFTSTLEDIDGLASSRYTAVEELLHASQEIYPNEQARWVALRPRFITALSSTITEDTTPKCRADGVIKFIDTNTALTAYCAVIELKNEIGTGKSDPSIEAAESYGIYWSHEKISQFRQICCCPSLIIAIAGPWMCVLGAIYLKSVVVQPLTEYIWLGHHPQQDRRLTQVTRVFNALAISMGELNQYYGRQRDRLVGPHPTSIDNMRFSPHVRRYTDTAGNTVHFEYSGFMGDLSVTRPVFKASTDNGEDIVVKFAERYNIGAHRVLAAKGLAPSVLSYEEPPSKGGYHTIVMEHRHCLTLKEYLTSHPGVEASELSTVRSDIDQALELLHGDGLVFGDLRMPNILVVEQDGGKVRGMLVDFDWCGRENVDRYPAGMNQGGIQWAKGVEKGGLMQRQHDREMFEKLFG